MKPIEIRWEGAGSAAQTRDGNTHGAAKSEVERRKRRRFEVFIESTK